MAAMLLDHVKVDDATPAEWLTAIATAHALTALALYVTDPTLQAELQR
jgi:hypothetical protein